MPALARAEIEALLRERKLDNTLTSARPLEVRDDQYVLPTGIDVLDARLGGGLARGQLSEIVGPRSSGRTTVLVSALAAAAARGELVALVDTFDTFDPASARTCGLDLTRLLWVRGRGAGLARRSAEGAEPSLGVSPANDRSDHAAAIDRALKSFNLILQAGGFGLVALDLADASSPAIRRLPFTTWFRLERPIEGGPTACVVVASEPVARSAGGVTIALRRTSADGAGVGAAWRRLFPGLDIEARIGRARGVAETCRFHLDAVPEHSGGRRQA